MKKWIIVLLAATLMSFGVQAFEYEAPADYPLMGDWQGRWINPKKGHEKAHPHMAAQLLPVPGGKYRVVILPELYNRAEPYLAVELPATHDRVEINQNSFEVVFEGRKVSGQATLHGDLTRFELEKVPFQPPSLGAKPPQGATVLFDGSTFDAWQHAEGKAVTWEQVGDAMQVVTMHNKQNKAKGLGGDIQSKDTFGSLRFHMEFRYPVEADKAGQGRGNSGLFFEPISEIQILNSYTTANYWNECGSIYKRVPAKVDASGPPLVWQTYDVEIELPKAGQQHAVLTVLLNGRLVHNKMEINCGAERLRIRLQDHINPIQFRNIWLVEE